MVSLRDQQALLGAGAAGGGIPFFHHANPVTRQLCPDHAAQSAALRAEHAEWADGRGEEKQRALATLEQRQMWEVAAQYANVWEPSAGGAGGAAAGAGGAADGMVPCGWRFGGGPDPWHAKNSIVESLKVGRRVIALPIHGLLVYGQPLLTGANPQPSPPALLVCSTACKANAHRDLHVRARPRPVLALAARTHRCSTRRRLSSRPSSACRRSG